MITTTNGMRRQRDDDLDSYSDDDESELLLIQAAKARNYSRVKELLNTGVNVNAHDEGGDTALSWAFARDHLEVIKLLIESSAYPNAKDKSGDSFTIAYRVPTNTSGAGDNHIADRKGR